MKRRANSRTGQLGSEQQQRQAIRRAQQPNVYAQQEIEKSQPVIDGKD